MITCGTILLLILGAASNRPSSFEDCLKLVRRSPDSPDSYTCFRVVALQRRQFGEAARHLSNLLQANPRNHRARLALAFVYEDQGHDRAEEMYRGAAQGFASDGDSRSEVYSRASLADFLMKRGRLADADVELGRGASLAEKGSARPLLPQIRIAQAFVAYRKADYSQAVRLLKRIEPDIFPEGPLYLRSRWLSAMGATRWATGPLEESMSCYRRQAELLHQAGGLYEEAVARVNLVLLARSFGVKREEYGALAREALAAAVAGHNRDAEASAHLHLSNATSGRDALEHARKGLEIAQELKHTDAISMGMRGVAYHLVNFDPGQAFRLIDDAIEQAHARDNLADVARGWVIRSRMRWKTGPRDQAISDSLAALGAIEITRDQQTDTLVRARRFSQWNIPYRELAGHLLDRPGSQPPPGDVELAFVVTERHRARMLLDELDAAQASPVLSAAEPLQQRLAAVLRGLVQVQRRLTRSALDDSERQQALRELERLELDETELREQLVRSNPAYAALRQPRFPTLQEVQRALAEDEALLAFQIGEGNEEGNRVSWLFVHTQSGTRVYPLSNTDRLSSSLPLFLGLVERRDRSEAEDAVQLYRDLLQKALEDLPPSSTRLVLVPEGILHRLPFEALRPNLDAEPLGARYQISLAPSTTTWLRWQRRGSAEAQMAALALADPALPSEAQTPSAMRNWSLATRVSVGRLPNARREARTLLRHVGGESRVLVGDEATEHHLKNTDLKPFGLLHLAAHAVIDDEHPERSAVLLSPGSEAEDGLLQVREVVKLKLNGQVVILSACRTASGTLLGGEGVMSLAHAFFQAGAHAVVASLWPLRDDETAALFDAFYRHLGEGLSIAAALTAARRDQIRKGTPAAAWAGLVVLGNGDIVPIPGGKKGLRIRFWHLLVPALLAVAGVFIVAQFLRRRNSANDQ